jgi:hypothetical protein
MEAVRRYFNKVENNVRNINDSAHNNELKLLNSAEVLNCGTLHMVWNRLCQLTSLLYRYCHAQCMHDSFNSLKFKCN